MIYKKGEIAHIINDPKKMLKFSNVSIVMNTIAKNMLLPKIPQTAPFKSNDMDRHANWRNTNAHPCLSYFDYIIEKEREERKRQKSVGKVTSTPVIEISPQEIANEKPEIPSIEQKTEIIKEENNQCPRCKSNKLEVKKSIEVGNIFKLKDRFTKAF